MNTDLRKIAKKDFEKDFFKSMNNAVFGKTMENVGKQRCKNYCNIKKKELFSIRTKLCYRTFFTELLLAVEMKITEILMNKPVYLGLSILELSKTLMYEFWYDYVKPKYEKAKSCYIDTVNFMMFIKILQKMLKLDLIFQIMDQINPCPKTKIKKIGLMKDELGGKIMTELVGLRAETYSYLLDDDSEDKKAKGTQICVINRKLKLNHKNHLGATQLDNKKNYLEKNQIDIVCKKIIKNS